MWDRVTFKTRAKAIMKEHYWKVFIACLIGSLLGITSSSGASIEWEYNTNSGLGMNAKLGLFEFPLSLGASLAISIMLVSLMIILLAAGFALNAFVIKPMRVGFCRYLVLTQQNGYPAPVGEFFWAFGSGHYMNIVKTMFFHDLHIFLWSLLFIIPGIIKRYEYTCVPYILAQHPEMDYQAVLRCSTAMTDGHKVDIWILGLSFLGWLFLGGLLFGIGTFFVLPYIALTEGEMYAFLRRRIFPDPNPEQQEFSYQNY